eukprot:scaffold738_cov340-Pavlova_lutheri.AAC.41
MFDAKRTTVFCDSGGSKPATFGEAFTHLPSMPPDKIREPGGYDAPAMVQATGEAALHILMEEQRRQGKGPQVRSAPGRTMRVE